MVLKEAHLSATLAWSPFNAFLAAGTAADSIDVSFSSTPVLQVLAPNFRDGGKQLPALGSPGNVQDSFNRLSWGSLETTKMGVIAGGLNDGGVVLWDPDKLAHGTAKNGGDVPGALLSRLTKHTGAVKGVEFNQHSKNLLATGGADGELAIWDIVNPASPTLYPALKAGAGGQSPQPEIASLAWNKRVEWILATCSINGTATVWDLKKQKPVITLRDTAGRMRRCSAVAWNPDVATQLLVACAEDMSPTIQLWDLRNNSAPIKELLGHNKGVLSLSWSLHDTSLLLSSGRDGRTLLWDVPSGSVSGEIQTSQGFVVEVAWCPTVPGVFASASFGDVQHNLVSVDNLASFTASRTQESYDENFAAQSVSAGAPPPLLKAPNWMKRPISATFGFGGKLVKAINTKRPLVEGGQPVQLGEIHLSYVVTEPELVKRTAEFEEVIAHQEIANLNDFCRAREAELRDVNKEESETWAFLSVLFVEDARRSLLKKLGFEDLMPQPPRTTEAGDLQVDSLTISGGRSPSASASATPRAAANDDDFFSKDEIDGGAAFFDELQPQSIPATPHKTPDQSPRPSHTAASDYIEEGEAGESEGAILRALYTGNFSAALDACLQGDRMADALVIGMMAGGPLAQQAQREYMRRHPRPYMKIVHAVTEKDLLSLVKSRPLDGWQETLAILCAYSDSNEFIDLCNALARRLSGVGLGHPAALVWICAGNVEKVIKHWVHTLQKAHSSSLELETVVERAVILDLGTQSPMTAPAFSDLVNQYAAILASQGQMPMALEFLDLVKGESTSSTAILRDRIVRSGAPGVENRSAPFPFIAEDVAGTLAPAPLPAPAAAAPAAARGAGDYYSRNAYNIAGSYGNGYAAAAPPAPVAPPPPTYGGTSGYGTSAPTAYQSAQAQYPQTSAYGGGYGDGYAGYGTTVPATAYPPPAQYVPLTGGGGSGTYGQQLQPPQVPPPPTVPQQAPPPPPQAAAAPQYGSANFFTPAAAPPVPPGPPMGSMDTAVGGGVYMPSRPSSSHTHVPAQVQPAATFVPTQTPAAIPPPAPINAPPNQFGAAPGGQYAPAPTQFTPTAAAAAGAGASAPATPLAPTGPPANISITTADVSEVPANLQVVVKALRALYDTCAAAVGSQPGKKREMEDNAKRLGTLFWKLNKNDVSPSVATALVQLAAALNSRDLAAATQIQVSLTATDWDECSTWLTALKRLLKTRQTLP